MSGSLAAFDAQALAGIGLSACVPELAASTSPARFVVSPFYDLGPFGMVFGNTGLAVLIGFAHYAAVLVKSHYVAQKRCTETTTPQKGSTSAAKLLTLCQHDAHVALRFPHYTMDASKLLLPGIAFGCAALVFRGDLGGIAGGLVAVAILVTALWARLRLIGRHPSVLKLVFTVYTRSEVSLAAKRLGGIVSKLPAWAVPIGRWLPREKSATHGRARSAVIGGQEWLSEYAVVFAVAMNFVGGLPLPATECGIVFGVACLIPFAGIVAMVWRRPCRVHLTTWLNVLQYVLTFSTLLVTSLLRAGVRGADGAILSLLALGLSFVTILKLIGTVAALMWETKVTALLLLLNQRVEGGQKLQQHRLVTGSTEIQLRDTSSGAGERHSSQSKSQSSSSNSHNEEAMQKPIYEDLLSYDQREALVMVLRMCCNNTHHHQNDPALELRKGEHRPTEESWSPVNLGDLRRGRRNELASVEPVLHSVYGARAQRQQQHAVSYRVVNQLL